MLPVVLKRPQDKILRGLLHLSRTRAKQKVQVRTQTTGGADATRYENDFRIELVCRCHNQITGIVRTGRSSLEL